MGTIPLDNGESVYIHDGTGSADPIAISAAEGSSLAALMAKRERFDFTWGIGGDRTAQTGMVQGSRGYQEDTKTEYIYDAGAWRVNPSYIQFDATDQTMAAATAQQMTGFATVSSVTTDSTLATWSTNHFILNRPGIYEISLQAFHSASSTTAWIALSTSSGWSPGSTAPVAISGVIAQSGSVSTLYRFTASTANIYLWNYGSTAHTLQQQVVRIVRLG
jgi:hypothetical protein